MDKSVKLSLLNFIIALASSVSFLFIKSFPIFDIMMLLSLIILLNIVMVKKNRIMLYITNFIFLTPIIFMLYMKDIFKNLNENLSFIYIYFILFVIYFYVIMYKEKRFKNLVDKFMLNNVLKEKNSMFILLSFIMSISFSVVVSFTNYSVVSLLLLLMYTYIIYKIKLTHGNKMFINLSLCIMVPCILFIIQTDKSKFDKFIENKYYLIFYFALFFINALILMYKERKLKS